MADKSSINSELRRMMLTMIQMVTIIMNSLLCIMDPHSQQSCTANTTDEYNFMTPCLEVTVMTIVVNFIDDQCSHTNI